MIDSLAFRQLYPKDIPQLRLLCSESFPIEYPDSWYDFVTSGYFYSNAAFNQNQMVGVIIAENKSYKQIQAEDVSIIARHFKYNRVGYILTLGVAKAYRSLGLGSYLLSRTLENLEDQNCLCVYLHVLKANKKAIAFYENRNFRQHASFPYYYTIKGIPCEGSSYVIYMNGGYRDYPFIFLLLKRFSLFIFICFQKIVTNICPNQRSRRRLKRFNCDSV